MISHSAEWHAKEAELKEFLGKQIDRVNSSARIAAKRRAEAEAKIEKPFINYKIEYVNKYCRYSPWDSAYFCQHLHVDKYNLSYTKTDNTIEFISYYIYLTFVATKAAPNLEPALRIYKGNLDVINNHLCEVKNEEYNNLFQIYKLLYIADKIETYATKEMLFDLLMALKNIIRTLRNDNPEKNKHIATRIIDTIHHYMVIKTRMGLL